MPSVRVKEGEPFNIALKRFKRACEKAGLMPDIRRLEYYEKPAWERKRREAAAVKRWKKKISRSVLTPLRTKKAKPKRSNDRRRGGNR